MVVGVCLCIYGSTPAFAAPGDYGWPLGREAGVAGGFGEYRESHFHTGIDFSTGDENGLPVYAVSAGRIYRLVDGLTGFGRAVYLKHADGNISVYAHLNGFADTTAQWVARRRRGLAFRDKLDTPVAPDELPPVKKGQVIGFSGESGAGLPHLHFELRSDEESPLQPFEFLPRPSDTDPPQFLSIEFLPASEDAEVNGDPNACRVEFRRRTPTGYAIDEPIELRGKFWVHLMVRDISPYRISPKRVEFSENGREWKSISFDKLSYTANENKKVGLLYDLASSSATAGLFTYRIYTSLPRPKAPTAAEVGLFDAALFLPGEHRLEFRIYDFADNRSEAVVPFRTSGPAVAGGRSERTSFLSAFIPAAAVRGDSLVGEDGQAFCAISKQAMYANVQMRLVKPKRQVSGGLGPDDSTMSALWVYHLAPLGLPLAEPVRFSIAVPKGKEIWWDRGSPPHRRPPPLNKFGIYRLNPLTEKWSFVGSMADTGAHTVSAHIDQTGAYGLFDDEKPPSIHGVYTHRIKKYGEVWASVSDGGCGIAADTGRVLVDGRPHEEWYYDPDRGTIRIRADQVREGSHTVEVTLSDRLGNTASRRWMFTAGEPTIKRKKDGRRRR